VVGVPGQSVRTEGEDEVGPHVGDQARDRTDAVLHGDGGEPAVDQRLRGVQPPVLADADDAEAVGEFTRADP
jgi:hypothetical protein